jgi:hypothetical protein
MTKDDLEKLRAEAMDSMPDDLNVHLKPAEVIWLLDHLRQDEPPASTWQRDPMHTWNAALTDEDIKELAKGTDPATIQPDRYRGPVNHPFQNPAPRRCCCGTYVWEVGTAQIEDSRGVLHFADRPCHHK